MTATATTRRIALYARVSTRDKGQDPKLQLVPMREYAMSRGWEVVEFVDHAAAGDLRRRTAWRELLKDAAQHRFDQVMVWKLDRAFRSTVAALSTLKDLDHWGVGFSALTQPELDTTSATGRLVFTILAAVAEMERELIAERVREGMALAKDNGKKLGRPSVTDSPTFQRRWAALRPAVESGAVSRRGAATQLKVGQATIRRLLSPIAASEAAP